MQLPASSFYLISFIKISQNKNHRVARIAQVTFPPFFLFYKFSIMEVLDNPDYQGCCFLPACISIYPICTSTPSFSKLMRFLEHAIGCLPLHPCPVKFLVYLFPVCLPVVKIAEPFVLIIDFIHYLKAQSESCGDEAVVFLHSVAFQKNLILTIKRPAFNPEQHI